MLYAFKCLINLFQRLSLRLHPIGPNHTNFQDIPSTIHHICLPAYGIQGEWERENTEKCNAVKEESEDAHPIGSDGIGKYFWRIEVEEWCPSERIRSLKEEYRCNCAVDSRFVRRRSVHC
ncbi:hypothetical protein ACMFMG_012215 [Clarireedia jacksonii]